MNRTLTYARDDVDQALDATSYRGRPEEAGFLLGNLRTQMIRENSETVTLDDLYDFFHSIPNCINADDWRLFRAALTRMGGEAAQRMHEWLMPWPCDKGGRLYSEWPGTHEMLKAALLESFNNGLRTAAEKLDDRAASEGELATDLAVAGNDSMALEMRSVSRVISEMAADLRSMTNEKHIVVKLDCETGKVIDPKPRESS